MKKYFITLCASLLILCLCASCTGIGFLSRKTGGPSQGLSDTDDGSQIDDADVALTIGSRKVSAAEYGYIYLMQYYNLINMAQQSEQMYGYNMYGFDYTMSPEDHDSPYSDDDGNPIKWSEQLKQTTVDYLQQLYTLYDLAISQNYKLTDEEQASIDEQIESRRESAAAADSDDNAESKTFDDYLQEQYGEGINEKYLRGLMEKEMIVQRFADDKEQSFRDQYTDEIVDQIYRENQDEYGDIEETVDVRHILFATIDLDTREPLTESEIAAKKEEAEKVLAQWTNLKNKTAEEFGKLAEKYTEDTGSKDNGGLYEKVTPGQMVDAFDKWIFDAERKEGDVEIIESEFGYHVMYYVGNKDFSYRDSIRTERTQTDYSSWLENELAKDSAKVTENSAGMEKGYAIAKQRIDNTVDQIKQYSSNDSDYNNDYNYSIDE